MKLAFLDWVFLAWFFGIEIWIGIYYARRASKSMQDYFIAGRNLPWFMAGLSMIATTFAADTPLAVCGLVIERGIAGNWLWWNMVFSGMLTVFFFAKLWRRTEAVTDVELSQIRYTGKPASFLRGFRAVYLGLPITGIIFGWVTVAMAKIINVTLNWPKWQGVAVCLALCLIYVTIAGAWGVVFADAFQFAIAMVGSILLAVFAVSNVGGIKGLKEGLITQYGASQTAEILNFFPQIGSAWMPVIFFVVYLAVQWWAAWYPGAEPGGGGYVAQKMLACRSEKDALFASFSFNIMHYALRPWPWILVALVGMVVYPGIADPEKVYPQAMVDFLPIGIRGLMIASFIAAYVSTIATQITLGASYLINDLYRPFIKKNATETHYVKASRIAIFIVTLVGTIVTYFMESVVGGWELVLNLAAGTGLVYILRWYWWRVNAWSEISAMLASFCIALALQFSPFNWAYRMLITVGGTTVVWLIVTFLTRPVKKEHLIWFYNKVRPAGAWGPIVKEVGKKKGEPILNNFIDFILGSIFIYSTLFGIGKFILGFWVQGIIYITVAIISFYLIYKHLARRQWAIVSEKQ